MELRPGEPPRVRPRRGSTTSSLWQAERPVRRLKSDRKSRAGLVVVVLAALAMRDMLVDCAPQGQTLDHHQRATEQATNLQLLAKNETITNQASQTQSMPSEESMKFPLYMRIIATLACLIIFTIGVCGNLLVPLVVIKTKYLRNSTNLFLINLSVADLLVLIVCMPTVLIELHSRPETWLLGEAMSGHAPVCNN